MHDSDERQRMGIWRRLSWNSSGRSWRGEYGAEKREKGCTGW